LANADFARLEAGGSQTRPYEFGRYGFASGRNKISLIKFVGP
jgi:hypothetical protein